MSAASSATAAEPPGTAPAPAAPARAPARPAPHRATLLLVEPNFMLRRTVALTARDLEVGEVHEATSYEAAAHLLASLRCDGLLIALDDGPAGIALIEQLRNAATASDPATPVAVLADHYDQARMDQLLALRVARALLKPAKIKDLVRTVMFLAQGGNPAAH